MIWRAGPAMQAGNVLPCLMPQIAIEPLASHDQALVWNMLYHAIFVPEGATPPARDIIQHPDLARYARGWGRAGDIGVKALRSAQREAIGAAWLRRFTAGAPGYGYLDEQTPELSLAVRPQCRGQGVGTQLLRALIEQAQGHVAAISLSVSLDNRAARLYQRFGFEVVCQRDQALTMVKWLTRTPAPESA